MSKGYKAPRSLRLAGMSAAAIMGMAGQASAQTADPAATDEFLLFGTKLEYAAYHQHGTSRMAQRRPLELTPADRRVPPKIIQSWILGGAEGPAIAMELGL